MTLVVGQLDVREGEEVEVSCIVEANPEASDVTWRKNVSRDFEDIIVTAPKFVIKESYHIIVKVAFRR